MHASGTKVFVSVGTALNPQQEAFVVAVEERLRAVGLVPCTIGRNTFSADAPLRAVTALMDDCAGAVVVAMERYFFDQGTERRGSAKQRPLQDVSFPTAWNQIEAALAYSRHLPLMVIVDERLRCDGLLEKGNDWYVQELPLDPAALHSPAFSGVMDSWRERVAEAERRDDKPAPDEAALDPARMSVSQLVGTLRPAQLWGALVALCGALAGAFALGAHLFPKLG